MKRSYLWELPVEEVLGLMKSREASDNLLSPPLLVETPLLSLHFALL
jgi:hypothetical protein